jgi:transcription antitermination protein NusB
MPKSVRQRRHKARILAMQAIFQHDARISDTESPLDISSFNWVDYPVPDDEREFAKKIISETLEHQAEIDELITDRLVNWDFARISPVSRAILRTGVAQLMYLAGEADAAVVIDESIQIARQYDATENTGFINGLLDDVHRHKDPSAPAQKKPAPLSQKIKIHKKKKPE